MRSILLSLALLTIITISPLTSQIVMNKADFPLQNSYESEGILSFQTGLTPPSIGENQEWDISNLTTSSEFGSTFYDATDDEFYTDAINYTEALYELNGNFIESKDFYTFDAQGYARIGRRITEAKYSTVLVTGGAEDSLKIVGGNFPFEERQDYIQFPLEYENTWTQSFNISTNYELTIANYGLIDAPGTYTQYRTQTRTVVGSGKLTMPNKDGEVITIDALLIRTDISTIDSVLLNGQPAPILLMAFFGLKQGATNSFVTYAYYAPGYGESVAYYDMEGGYISYIAISEITSSVEAEELNTLNVYPNPVKIGSSFTIENSKNNISSISIVDQTGKVVYSIEVNIFNNHLNVEIPNILSTGVYLIQSNNRQGKLVSTSKLIVE